MINKYQKLIKSLHQKKFRSSENLFLVEGGKSILELFSAENNFNKISIQALFYTEHFAQENQELLPLFQKQVAHSELVTQTILHSVGTLQTNENAIAVAKMPANFPLKVENEMVLALADIRDPGNLGTIIRIADWYGIRKLICSETTTDFYSPKVIAASMGSFLRVKPFYCDLAQYLAMQTDMGIYGAFLKGKNIYEQKFEQRGIIVIGNESNGIPDDLVGYIPNKITIPRFGEAESLNAGIATAIICDNWRRGA
ncbi:MAG: RNA methyltransferase [Cytophagales bacterium]|nr:MAG: RNA methyltransferase [Cytophagales bacterium]